MSSNTPHLHPLKPLLYKPLGDAPKISPEIGKRPEPAFLPLSLLVTDDRYQRAVTKQGRPNIIKIYEEFFWPKFAPLIVTPTGDGRYSIIDGQHRATAAMMRGDVDEVPCIIVELSPEQAAECFAALNGNVTRITLGQIWKARVAAGDKIALAVTKVLDAADVQILAYKFPQSPYKPGETLAIKTLEISYQKYGADILTTALQAITQTGGGNAGCLTAPAINALCEIVKSNREFQARPTTLFDLMDEINLPDFLIEASFEARKAKQSPTEVIRSRLSKYFREAMKVSA